MMQTGAAAEWRHNFMLPIAAGLGYATSVIHIYSLGVYIGPISEEFGWSRVQVTSGHAIATAIGALFGIPIGLLLDRVGPRYFGVIGLPVALAGSTLISTATGDPANWYMIWALMALTGLALHTTVWTSAVATKFEASRGLALAVTLCGASVGASLFPFLASTLITHYGWRVAFVAQAGIWFVIAYPIILMFFRGAYDKPAKNAASQERSERSGSGVQFIDGLKSTAYIRLLLASLLFTFPTIAIVIHFVPILSGNGFSAIAAGGVAALIGLSSIVGRLATGMLLDRFRGSLVGGAAFLFPAIGCVLLLTAGHTYAGVAAAAILIGLSVGAEMDVIVFLTTRYFGLKSFGGLFGGLLVAISLSVATGPLGAAYGYDLFGSYSYFLYLAIGLMVMSSLCLASLPRPTFVPNRR